MAEARSSIIAPCTCKHEGQDAMYGKGMRVWNAAGDKTGYRCTVCNVVMGDAPKRITKMERILKQKNSRQP